MSALAPAPPPETLYEVSRTIRELQEALDQLDQSIEKPRLPARIAHWLRKKQASSAVTAFLLLGLVATAFYYIGFRIYGATRTKFDTHIALAIDPLHKQILAADSDTKRMEGMLAVLQTKVLVRELSAVPELQLREHRDELREARKLLAAANPETPGFWPAGFQLIALLSRATSAVEIEKSKEVEVNDFSGGAVPGEFGSRFVLTGQIKNASFTDAIVRLDPDVKLENVSFKDCVIILPDVPKPPKSLQQIASEFLASDLLAVTIHGS